jgi:rhomboid protease GluP
MPKHEEIIIIDGVDNEKALAISYEVFKKLGWSIDFAGNDKILGNTPKSWKTKGQQIIVGNNENGFFVLSEMVNGESLDITGVNKKNVASFIKIFAEIKQTISQESIDINKVAIADLVEITIASNKQQETDAAEIDAAMNLSGSNLYATYAIIAINLLVFILMVIDGAGIMDLNSLIHIKWGSNYTPLTLSGDWWRLITSTFIHFGIIHVLMNMYCLYSIGVYLEPMLGKLKYVTAYLCTGVLASLVSLWWHLPEGTNSAGASGAVFGMYGLFLALLSTNLIPKAVRDSLLQSIGIFIFYNLAYGMKGGVDNSAHIGGLISGFIVGYLLVIGIKKEKNGLKATWILPLVIAGTIITSYLYLEKNNQPVSSRKDILAEVDEAKFKDTERFNNNYNEFVKIQDSAINVMNDSALNNKEMQDKLATFSIKSWNEAEVILKQMQMLDVSTAKKAKAGEILKYITLKKEEVLNYIDYLNNKDGAVERLDSTRINISQIIETLK